MKFEPAFIEKVRDANNIVDVISEFTQLKGTGGRLMGLCPFPGHKEKTPSFSVSTDKQVYYCFGCKKAGNIYTFVQEMKGLSFPESVEYLAQKASIPVPKEAYESDGRRTPTEKDRQQKRVMGRLNDIAAEFFHQQLLRQASSAAAEYARRRGLSRETIARFQVGFASEEWDALVRHLDKIRAPVAAAEKLGLVRKRNSGSGYYDLFRGRLMFPILSATGECVGFGGRTLTDAQPKYLNSPESEVFNKGKMFYGLNETAKFIREADQAIVVEGYMDLLALYQAGLTNVVATLGTALTRDHARLISRYTRNVLVLFDGDAAGWTAAERSLPILLEAGLVPRHFLIPGGKDPDDHLKELGAGAFRKALDQAPELFYTVLQRLFTNYHGQPGEKVLIVDALQPILGSMKDPRLKDLYLAEVADRLQVEMNWLKGAMHAPKESVAVKPASVPKPNPPLTEEAAAKVPYGEGARIVVRKPPRAELYLVNLALLREDNLKALLEADLPAQFQHAGLREIFRRMAEAYRQMPSEFDKLTASLTSVVEPAAVVSLHLEKTWAEMDIEGERKLISDCTRKVREAFLRAQAREQIVGLRGQPASEQLKKLEQIVNIHSDRRNLQKDNT